MNYNSSNFKKLLSEPVENIIKTIIYSVYYLTPIKNNSYKRHIKYTIEDYIIGIIDVLSNYVSCNKYNGFMKSDTLRKKHNEWTSGNKIGKPIYFPRSPPRKLKQCFNFRMD